MKRFILSVRFYLGIALIVGSLILGKVTILTFLGTESYTTQVISVVVYILSWPMLGWGAYWAGKEYADALRKYASVKYYHDSAKKGARRVVRVGREGTRRVVTHGKRVVEVGKEGTRRVVRKSKRVGGQLKKRLKR